MKPVPTDRKADSEHAPRTSSRPPELQDWLNARIYHPLARQLALALRHTLVTPNMVSAAGFLSILAAAFIYSRDAGLGAAILGLTVHMTWHVFDGADGDLARLTGQASPMGELIDGLSDYFGHIILYLVLGFALFDQIGAAAWAVMLAAGAARIVQANFFEAQRRQYQYWIYRQPWLGMGQDGETLGILSNAYHGLARIMVRRGQAIGAELSQSSAQERAKLTSLIKREYAPLLSRLNILSANYRTLALGLSMIAGSPVYFFLFEIVLLTAALMVLMIQARAVNNLIIAQLSDNNSR